MPSIIIEGSHLAYEEVGTGFPVILGHSYLWDSRMWRSQVDELSLRYRCLVPDLWGHGRSGPLPARTRTLESLADDYEAFIDALGLKEYALVGLSVGGMWAARVAVRRPTQVKALVLMDTYLGAEPEVTRQRYFSLLDAVETAGVFPPGVIDQVAPLFFGEPWSPRFPRLIEGFRTNLAAFDRPHIDSIVPLGRAIFGRPSFLGALTTLTVPTLVAVGDEDRPRPVHESQEMVKLIPRASLAVIPRAGHISAVEQPDLTSALLLEFLNSLTPGR